MATENEDLGKAVLELVNNQNKVKSVENTINVYKTASGEVVLNMKKVQELQEDYMNKWIKDHKKQEEVLKEEYKKSAEYIKALRDAEKKAKETAIKYEDNLYKKASYNRKKEMVSERLLAVEQTKKKLAEMEAEEIKSAGRSEKKIAEIKKKHLKEYMALEAEKDKQMIRNQALRQAENNTAGLGLSTSDKIKARAQALTESASVWRKRAQDTYRDAYMEEDAQTKSELMARAKAEARRAIREEDQAKILGAIQKSVDSIKSKMNSSVDDAMKNISTYMPILDTRLQGTTKSYQSISDMLKSNLAASPFVAQTKVLENIGKAVEQGIAYNVEQRAFLDTVSDRMVQTFDAFDKNLTRLIKLQQADTTAARMGIEASLTELLNAKFSDTSYLSDLYDTVSAALVETSSQLTRESSVEFEYTVQKWLGSLYSLGMSDSFISKVAQGINYLGTGDVAGLAGNESLQTLMAMSASRAGLPYADLLTGGMTASATNKLLESMVGYLKDIAETSSNQVVKSAYGNIFGLSLADMRAISNLTTADIGNLTKQTMSFSDAMESFSTQLNMVAGRTSLSQKVDNAISNMLYTMGAQISENVATYGTWKIASLIEESTGGIHIPAVSVLGNMVDLSSFTVEGIMKSGIAGYGLLSSLGSILGSIGAKGGIDMSRWGGSEFLSRGEGFTRGAGATSGVSSSSYIGSGSSSDMYNASIASATSQAESTAEITNKNVKATYQLDDIYKSLFIDKIPVTVDMSSNMEAYLKAQLAEIVDTIVNNSALAIAEEGAIPVKVSSTDAPVKVEVTNSDIVDYYNQRTLLPVGLF